MSEEKKCNNKKNEILLNYSLTLGFIFIIVFFISTLILISRFVLVGTTIGEHVQITKNLISDISKVEENIDQNKTKINNLEILNLNPSSAKVISQSILNTKNNQSYITLKLNTTIENNSNYFYIHIKNYSNLNKGSNIVILNKENKPEIVKFVSKEDKIIFAFNYNKQEVEKINQSKVLGELIFKNEEN